MATRNPYAGDDTKGDAWEQGYLAGFAEPEDDHFRPFSPELLEVYEEGEQSGRDDRRRLPPEAGGVMTSPAGHGGLIETLIEIAREIGIHVLGHIILHKAFKAVGGLAGLLLLVLEIPGDTALRPLDPDWSGPVDQPDDTYIAVCPRDDHPVVLQGATNEGYWAGPGRSTYGDALADMVAHGHAEAFVARCSLPEGTCGPVWPGQGQ